MKKFPFQNTVFDFGPALRYKGGTMNSVVKPPVDIVLPNWTKIRWTKLSKFWLGVENFVRRNILSDEILADKVKSLQF